MQLWESDRAADVSYASNGKYKAPLGPESNSLAWEDSEKRILKSISDKMHARSAYLHDERTPEPALTH